MQSHIYLSGEPKNIFSIVLQMEKNTPVSWHIPLEIFSALNQSTKTRVYCSNPGGSIISNILILCSCSFSTDATWLLTVTKLSNGDFLWKKDRLYVHTAYSLHVRAIHKNLGEFISRCTLTHIFSFFLSIKFSLQEIKHLRWKRQSTRRVKSSEQAITKNSVSLYRQVMI